MKRVSILLSGLVMSVGLLVGGSIARANLLNFALTDGTNHISFQLDSNPVPTGLTLAGFPYFLNMLVNVNGAVSTHAIAFPDSSFLGGLVIYPANTVNCVQPTVCLLNQVGPQLWTGTANAPVFAGGTISLSNGGNATFSGNFSLITSVISAVPEPATLALIGLGLSSLALTRRRRAQ